MNKMNALSRNEKKCNFGSKWKKVHLLYENDSYNFFGLKGKKKEFFLKGNFFGLKEKISNKILYWSSEYIHKLSSYEFFKIFIKIQNSQHYNAWIFSDDQYIIL